MGGVLKEAKILLIYKPSCQKAGLQCNVSMSESHAQMPQCFCLLGTSFISYIHSSGKSNERAEYDW